MERLKVFVEMRWGAHCHDDLSVHVFVQQQRPRRLLLLLWPLL